MAGARLRAVSSNRAAHLRVVQAFAEALIPSMPAAAATEAERGNEHAEKFYRMSGSEGKEACEDVLVRVQHYLPPIIAFRLWVFFNLLATRLGTLLLAGYLALTSTFPFVAKFEDLPLRRRERILQAWAGSWLPRLRMAFTGLKSLVALALFTRLDDEGSNVLLRVLGYERPPAAKPSMEVLEAEAQLAEAIVDLQEVRAQVQQGLVGSLVDVLRSRGLAVRAAGQTDQALAGGTEPPAAVIECDAVVVGSGAGGGVAAAVLAAAGLVASLFQLTGATRLDIIRLRVVVLEKSVQKPTGSLTLQEGESVRTMYENGGVVLSADGTVNILAGSVLGGGTKINWTAAIRPPPNVVAEWAQLLGDSGFPERYTASLDAVCERMDVRPHCHHNTHNTRMREALEAAGLQPEDYDHNCSQEGCSAFCTLGCPSGRKQGTDASFLADAVRAGAKILTCAYAERVLWEAIPAGALQERRTAPGAPSKVARGLLVRAGFANSVFAYAGIGEEAAPRLLVRADLVICAAGALHTPPLMLRSSIRGGGTIGANLRLHPSSVVQGFFPRREGAAGAGKDGSVRLWEGGLMGVISRAALEPSGYGPHLSVAIAHPAMIAAMSPWTSGAAYKKKMMRMGDLVLALNFSRDQDSGRVSISGHTGRPQYDYWPSSRDQRSMLRGIEACVRALVAAGADEVQTLHVAGLEFRPTPGGGQQELEAFIRKIWRQGVRRHSLTVLSAHQMSSARMGRDPEASACDPTGRCWEVEGLYVADGSGLPTCSGVNPMLSIMAMAHMVASDIAEQAAAMVGTEGSGGTGTAGCAKTRAGRVKYD